MPLLTKQILWMEVLEPIADGFRNYQKADYTLTAEQLLVGQITITNSYCSRNDCFSGWYESFK